MPVLRRAYLDMFPWLAIAAILAMAAVISWPEMQRVFADRAPVIYAAAGVIYWALTINAAPKNTVWMVLGVRVVPIAVLLYPTNDPIGLVIAALTCGVILCGIGVVNISSVGHPSEVAMFVSIPGTLLFWGAMGPGVTWWILLPIGAIGFSRYFATTRAFAETKVTAAAQCS